MQANIENQDQERQKHQEIAQSDIAESILAHQRPYRTLGLQRTMHQALEEAQHIPRGRNNHQSTQNTERRVCSEGTEQREKLASKTIQARQTERGERGNQSQRCQNRHLSCQTTEIVQVAGTRTLLNQVSDKKESGNCNAVIHHLQDRADGPLAAESEDTEHNHTQMADTRIGKQALHIGLHQSRV